MNKLIIDILSKNKNMDIMFIGNKSIDNVVVKLKLLSGIKVDNLNISDFSFDNYYYSNPYKLIFDNKSYDSHKLINLDMLPVLEVKFRDINKYVGLYDYKNCLSFLIDCTRIDLSNKLNYIFKLLNPIVHHPLLVISSDTLEAKIYNMGYFYELNRDNIVKVFNLYNEVHSCKGFYDI